MKSSVAQKMWEYQEQFRLQVEWEIEQVLQEIGLSVEPRAVLVGFSCEDGSQTQLSIEPADGPLALAQLSHVEERALELYQTEHHPIIGGDDEDREMWHARRRRQLRADALVEAIEWSGAFEGYTFFASESTPISDFELHLCVGVPTADLDSLPVLEQKWTGAMEMERSLHHAVIRRCLHSADRALESRNPGVRFRILDAPRDMIEAAAEDLLHTIAFVVGLYILPRLFDPINAFTSLGYERTGAAGRLFVGSSERVLDMAKICFETPILLRDTRIMRKVLQLSDESMGVLMDDRQAYGLGIPNPDSDIAEVVVQGHATWEISYGGSPLMRVSYGRATLPRPPVDRVEFEDVADRTLGSIAVDQIWDLVQEAQEAQQGSTLVISHDPEGESTRLGGQAVTIEPSQLRPADIIRLGRVDGAIILGRDGRCYAFGVILDGKASLGRGDAARGSRFNSAVRYQHTMAKRSLVIVISDDGLVNLVPRLRPKIQKTEVEQAVAAFCLSCEADPFDGEAFWRTYRRVTKLEFYLSNAQCKRVNDCHERVILQYSGEDGDPLRTTPLRSHPDMDDSYFE